MSSCYQRQHDLQKQGVIDYFTKDPGNWDIVYEYLRKDKVPRYSRRFWDYLVTEYSRTHNCQYPLVRENGETVMFNIYHSAQTLLLGVHKRGLDAFNRRNSYLKEGGCFVFGHGEKRVNTSVCQLNFFRWLVQNKVHLYGEQHEIPIKKEMARTSHLKRRQKKRRKRAKAVRQLSIYLPNKTIPQEDDHDARIKRETNEMAVRRRRRFIELNKHRRHADNVVDTVINNNCKFVFVFNEGTVGD